MPKIGNRFISSSTGRSVELIVYYVSSKEGNYFSATTVNPQYLISKHPLLKYVNIGATSKTVIGIKADSEAELLSKWKEYIIQWEKESLTKEPLIFIEVSESSGENLYFRKKPGESKSWYNDVRQTGCKIDFHYIFGYKMNVAGKDMYYKDGTYMTYESSDKDEVIYDSDLKDYTVIPGTPDNLLKCESIIEQMNALTDRLMEMFKDSDTAQQTLANSNVKLIGQG